MNTLNSKQSNKHSSKNSKHKSRLQRGSVTVEFVSTIPLIIILALLSVDLIVLLSVMRFNDVAARNCARVAAQAENRAEAERNVMSTIRAYAGKQDGSLGHPRVLLDDMQYVETDNETEGPYVWVKTTTKAQMPFPIPVFGQWVGLSQDITLQQAYAFPIVNLALPGDAAPTFQSN